MLTALLFFSGIIFALNLFTYSFFWYEAKNARGLGEEGQNPPEKALGRLIGRGILSGSISLALVIVTYPLGLLKRYRIAQSDPSCALPPVILVHGLFHNASAWILFRWRLKRAGFLNIYLLSYNSWASDFPEILGELEALVLKVSLNHPGKAPVLVGHSLGGLLCRAYLEQAKESCKNVCAAVTLGAPHQGSTLSVFGLSPLARSLAYRGNLIEELERKRKPCPVPRLAVHTPADNMVLPPGACLLPYEGWSYHKTAPISHLSLLYHPPTAKVVIDFIKACHSARSC